MASSSVESRFENLETQVSKLQDELRSIRHAKKDWRRTIGAFTDDVGMQDLVKEALRLREADRKKARSEADDDRRTNG